MWLKWKRKKYGYDDVRAREQSREKTWRKNASGNWDESGLGSMRSGWVCGGTEHEHSPPIQYEMWLWINTLFLSAIYQRHTTSVTVEGSGRVWLIGWWVGWVGGGSGWFWLVLVGWGLGWGWWVGGGVLPQWWRAPCLRPGPGLRQWGWCRRVGSGCSSPLQPQQQKLLVNNHCTWQYDSV